MVERIRASGVDVVLNLTAGMGGDLVLGGAESPLPLDEAGTDLAGASERLAHVAELRPEICTLDCGTMNFAAGGDYVMVNTPAVLRAMAAHVQELGVRPELEVFDTGHLVFVKELMREGLIDDPAADPALHGHPLRRAGRPLDPARAGATSCRPGPSSPRSRSAAWSCPTSPWRCWRAATCAWGWRTTSTCRAASWPPTAQLVERAVAILEAMNVRVLGPADVRERLRLRGPA